MISEGDNSAPNLVINEYYNQPVLSSSGELVEQAYRLAWNDNGGRAAVWSGYNVGGPWGCGSAFLAFGLASGKTMNDQADTGIGRAQAGTLKLVNSFAGVKASQTLSDNGSVIIDASTGMTHVIALAGDATSSTITKPVEGQQLTIIWKQDAVGDRAYAWPANCKFANGAPPDASTTVGYQDSVTFVFDGTYWLEVSRAPAIH
jgi:hypothetical protein